MVKLDPSHELPAGEEPIELPGPHHPAGWPWLFAFVLSTMMTFMLMLALLASAMDITLVSIIGVITLVISTFITHAVAERAR